MLRLPKFEYRSPKSAAEAVALLGNAIEDAPAPLGVEVEGSHLRPDNVMAMIWKAKGKRVAAR